VTRCEFSCVYVIMGGQAAMEAPVQLPKLVMAYCRHPANIRVYCTDPSPTRFNLPELAMNCANLARGLSRNWPGLNESTPDYADPSRIISSN
jgi:hypothetical protein